MTRRNHASAILESRYPDAAGLDFEVFRELYYQYFGSAETGYYCAQMFTTLSESTILAKYFLSFPLKLQRIIVITLQRGPLAKSGNSDPSKNVDAMRNIVDTVLLSFRVEDKYPQLADCWDLSFYALADKVQEVEPTQEDALDHLSQRLLEIRKSNEATRGDFISVMLDKAAYFLVALHGPELVTEVLNNLPKHFWDLEPYQLTVLVENWNSSVGMPTEWTLALFQPDF